jgi:uncharacterized protein YutE (UPF0331/DUF86 family)
MLKPPCPLTISEVVEIMKKVTDIGSERDERELLRAASAHPEASADLADMLAAFSGKIFEGCAAIGQDGCNMFVTVTEANIIQQASQALRRSLRT